MKKSDLDSYYVIAAMRTKNDLIHQMRVEGQDSKELGEMRFYDGLSLLEVALANRNYEISIYLIENNVPVNVKTKNNDNELSIIAPHLADNRAVAIAHMLLNMKVDLTICDRKYHNTVMYSIALQILTHQNESNMKFLEMCLKQGRGIYEKNKSGFSTYDLLKKFDRCDLL